MVKEALRAMHTGAVVAGACVHLLAGNDDAAGHRRPDELVPRHGDRPYGLLEGYPGGLLDKGHLHAKVPSAGQQPSQQS